MLRSGERQRVGICRLAGARRYTGQAGSRFESPATLRMNLRAFFLGAWGVTAGLVTLVFGGVAWRLEVRREAATTAAALRDQEIVRLKTERARLEVDRHRAAPVSAVHLAARAMRVPGATSAVEDITESAVRKEAMLSLAELKNEDRFVLLPGTGPTRESGDAWSLERDGRPSPAFGLLFGLTGDQLRELQVAAERVRSRVAELAVTQAVLRRSEAGRVILDIAEAPEIERLRGELRTAFEDAVGFDGMAAYEGLRPGGFGGLLDSFGLGKRVVTIERRGRLYDVRDATDGNVPNSGRGASWTGLDRQDVEQRLGTLYRLMPPDFFLQPTRP